MDKFIYTDSRAGRQDLVAFSSMNCHEGRTLYLVVVAGGFSIVRQPTDGQTINAIAHNGRVFLPTTHPLG